VDNVSSTRLLGNALFLSENCRISDVGGYRALEFVVRGQEHYWTTADVTDAQGSGHLEVTVVSGVARPTLADLQRHSATTGVERRQPDGGVVTICTTTSQEPAAVITTRAALVRSDGTYIEVLVRNEDSVTSGPTRATPPLDAEAVLAAVVDLRPR